MPSNDEIARVIGNLEGRMDAQDRLLVNIQTEIHSLTEFMYKAKGSWQILMILIGMASAFGALVSELVHWIKGG